MSLLNIFLIGFTLKYRIGEGVERRTQSPHIRRPRSNKLVIRTIARDLSEALRLWSGEVKIGQEAREGLENPSHWKSISTIHNFEQQNRSHKDHLLEALLQGYPDASPLHVLPQLPPGCGQQCLSSWPACPWGQGQEP